MDADVQQALRDIQAAVDRHAQEVEVRLDSLTVAQYDLRNDIRAAAAEARVAADAASVAAAQARETNGRLRAIEIWRAMVEGGGKVINVQIGLLFGSGILLSVTLFIAGLLWGQ